MTELYQLIILSLKNHTKYEVHVILFSSAYKTGHVHVGHRVLTSLLPGKWINTLRTDAFYLLGLWTPDEWCRETKRCMFASRSGGWVSGIIIVQMWRIIQPLEAVWSLSSAVQGVRLIPAHINVSIWTRGNSVETFVILSQTFPQLFDWFGSNIWFFHSE